MNFLKQWLSNTGMVISVKFGTREQRWQWGWQGAPYQLVKIEAVILTVGIDVYVTAG